MVKKSIVAEVSFETGVNTHVDIVRALIDASSYLVVAEMILHIQNSSINTD